MNGLKLLMLFSIGALFTLFSFGCSETDYWQDHVTDPLLGFTVKPKAYIILNTSYGEVMEMDQAVIDHISTSWDFTQQVVGGYDEVDVALAGLSDVIICSQSISSGLAAPLRNITTPLLFYEVYAARQNVLGIVNSNDAGDTSYEYADGGEIDIVDNTHELAAGFSGTVDTGLYEVTFCVPGPAINYHKIATVAGDPDKVVLLGMEAGTTLYNDIDVADGSDKTGAKVVFYGCDWPADFNSNGWKLFDAALFWLHPPEEE